MKGSKGCDRGAVKLSLPCHKLAERYVAVPEQSGQCKERFTGDFLAASPHSKILPWLAKTKRCYSAHAVLDFLGLILLLLRTEIELTEVN